MVEVDIDNHSRAPIKNIEVTFGGGTYGRSSVAAGSMHHNRIKVFSAAPIQVQYDDVTGAHHTSVGPQLTKNADGSLTLTVDDSGARWSGSASTR